MIAPEFVSPHDVSVRTISGLRVSVLGGVSIVTVSICDWYTQSVSIDDLIQSQASVAMISWNSCLLARYDWINTDPVSLERDVAV